MNHWNEEQLILLYYGESEDADGHLDGCAPCRERFALLQRTLHTLDEMPLPECPEEYGGEVWRQIEGRLQPPRRRWLPDGLWRWDWRWDWRWAPAAAACAAMLVGAFLLGRYSQRPQPGPAKTVAATADPQAGQRVLLVAVGDYLDRSHVMLVELSNADPTRPHDITWAQERAGDLLSESRLYRQTAAHTGDAAIAGVLEELDRVLLDIAHAPSQASPAEMARLQDSLEARGILFKIQILNSNVQQRQL